MADSDSPRQGAAERPDLDALLDELEGCLEEQRRLLEADDLEAMGHSADRVTRLIEQLEARPLTEARRDRLKRLAKLHDRLHRQLVEKREEAREALKQIGEGTKLLRAYGAD